MIYDWTSGNDPNVYFYNRSICILLAMNVWTFIFSIYLESHSSVAGFFAVYIIAAERVPTEFRKDTVTKSIDKTECTKFLSKDIQCCSHVSGMAWALKIILHDFL